MRSDSHAITVGDQLLEEVRHELSNWIIGQTHFTFDQRLSSNSFATTFLARSGQRQVIVKEFPAEPLVGRKLIRFCREVQTLARSAHPFVVPFVGFSLKPPFRIVTEYVGPFTLYSMLHKQKRVLSGTERTLIAMGLASAFAHLHKIGVLHRNLNSGHVLLDDRLLPRVCDFADARVAATQDQGPLTTRIGTPSWAAPEMFVGNCYNGKVDVYSYGMILFELISDSIPFRALKTNEIVTAIVRRRERPPLPVRIGEELRNLVEVCWTTVPEKRISFDRIYELFATHKVAFQGTDESQVDALAGMIAEWRGQHPLNEDEWTMNKVISFFRSEDPLSVLSLCQRITVTSFRPLLRAILTCLGTKEESDEVIASALFCVLHLISHDEECLEHFATSVRWGDLPISHPKIGGIALSLVIPVLEKYPKSADAELLGTIRAQIPRQPGKALRLLDIITDAMTDETFDARTCTVLLDWADAFIESGAGRLYLNTLFKLLHRLRSFRAHKVKQVIALLVKCLTVPDFDVVDAALRVLRSLRPILLPVEPVVLLGLLGSEFFVIQTLQLMIVAKPATVSIELIECLANYADNEYAQIVLLSLCRTKDGAALVIENPSAWLLRPNLSIYVQLQILLILMASSANQTQLQRLENLPQLLASLALEGDSKVTTAVAVAVKKLNADDDFLNRIVAAGVVESVINGAITAKDDDLFSKTYLLVRAVSRFGFLDGFSSLVPQAMEHIQSTSKLSLSALRFLELMTRFSDGLAAMKAAGVAKVLADRMSHFPVEMKDLAERVLSPLSE
jgi:serine/threonine protein kinase